MTFIGSKIASRTSRQKIADIMQRIVTDISNSRLLHPRTSATKPPPIKIAIDGGAFQQGLSAGIYNVSVGLINYINKLRSDIEIIIITDPRFGGINEELTSRLSIQPQIIEIPVPLSESIHYSSCVGHEADVRFEVDGVMHLPIKMAEICIYRGPAPKYSFRILSRADRPKYTGAGTDLRKLGISLSRLEILSNDNISTISVNDPQLISGFYPAEESWRWTDGRAELPLCLFPTGEIEVRIGVAGSTVYRYTNNEVDKFVQALPIEKGILQEIDDFESILQDKGVQFYLCNHFIPLLFKKLKLLAINYDIIPCIYPDAFTRDALTNFASNLRCFERAEHVFSISEFSRSELIEKTGIHPSRVSAVLIDSDPCFRRAEASVIGRVRAKFGLLDNDFIVCVGTLEPRKNHKRLIEAFGLISGRQLSHLKLLIVGRQGWGTDDISEFTERMSLSQEVLFLERVSNEELAALYSGAIFSIYVSIYEGFGLPILEAMACGCPVIASNTSSMPEVGGDAVLYVDPISVDSIRQAMQSMLDAPELRNRLSAKGLHLRNSFSWNLTATRVLQIIDEITEGIERLQKPI